MVIRCKEDLRDAYLIARHIPRMATTEFKREMRAYTHKPTPNFRIVKEYVDGYVILYPLPEHLETANEAEEFFEQHEYIDSPNSPYDCTGRAFTEWYKIIKKNGRFWAYHSIGYDV